MAQSPETNKKYFDVSKPGRTAPSTTSRPSIVGHRTIMKDPMMVSGAPADDMGMEGKTPEPLAKTAGVTIKPLEEAPVEDDKVDVAVGRVEKSAAPQANQKDEPAPEASKATSENDTNVVKKPDEQPAASEVSKDSAEPESTEPSDNGTPSDEQQKKNDKLAQEAAAKQEAIEKAVAEKTYFVPINEHRHHRSSTRRLLVVILLLVLGIAFANVLIDSGTIQTDIKPLVHLFKTAE